MLKLDEYIEMSQKIILQSRYRSFIYDNEAIGRVARNIMLADIKFDQIDNENASREGIRYSYAYYAMLDILKDKYRHNHVKTNTENPKTNFDILYNIPADDESTENQELVDLILTSTSISNTHKDQISMYYLDNYTLKEIADKYNVTCEAVRRNINRGILKLRKRWKSLVE